MVAVIMPVYNTPRKLFENACYSVLNQTKHCLLFVIDDHSTEENSQDYSDFCAREGIYYHRLTENGGPGAARQYGINHIMKNIDYVTFLDSDDVLMPDFVECAYQEAIKANADIVATQIKCRGKVRTNDHIIDEHNIVWVHGKLYKTEFLRKKNIRFATDIRCNEDIHFNYIAFSEAENIITLEQIGHIWINNDKSITRRQSIDEFFIQESVPLVKIYCTIIKELTTRNKPKLIPRLVAYIFDRYNYELCRENQMNEIEDCLKDMLINSTFDFNEEFIKKMSPHLGTHDNNNLFRISPYDFIEHLKELRNE